MKYFTKEWYAAYRRSGALYYKTIPDKDCTEENIAEIYRNFKEYCRQRAQESKQDKKSARSTFTIRWNNLKRRAKAVLPEWVIETVDERLTALGFIPESVYAALKEEIDAEMEIYEKRLGDGRAVLKAQRIPREIKSRFRFSNATVLGARRSGKDFHLFIESDGEDKCSPRVKIIFRNAYSVDREIGLRIVTGEDEKYGFVFSNCKYLYEEIYRTDRGYEFHFLLWTQRALRYLTVACEDVEFDENFDIGEIRKGK